jgi:hypothetical protein
MTYRAPTTACCCLEGCGRVRLFPDVLCEGHAAADYEKKLNAEQQLRTHEHRHAMEKQKKEKR